MAIAAASIYGACRCNGLSRLVDDVSEMARVAATTAAPTRRAPNNAAKPMDLSDCTVLVSMFPTFAGAHLVHSGWSHRTYTSPWEMDVQLWVG